MAQINKKLIHFRTKAKFEERLAANDILETSIVFIQDEKLIWTHGTYYSESSGGNGDIVLQEIKLNLEPQVGTDLTATLEQDIANQLSAIKTNEFFRVRTITGGLSFYCIRRDGGRFECLQYDAGNANVAHFEFTFTISGITITYTYNVKFLALRDSVLSKTNTTEYTPTGDYNPATKKYVDDNKFSGSYTDLTNKPSIPSKTSQLTNDSGFVLNTDSRLSDSRPASDVSSWAKAPEKPTYVWTEIGDKPVLATVATSGSYNDLLNKPTIPAAYTLPTASSNTLGGVKIGYPESGKNYPVELNGSGQMFVNVPWTDTTYSAATTSANGLMSSSDKTKMDRLESYTTATTLASLNVNYQTIYVTLSANVSISASATGTTYNGRSITAYVYCSSARTITIPTSGNYVSMCGSSYTCPAGKWVEFNLTCIAGVWHIAMLEME